MEPAGFTPVQPVTPMTADTSAVLTDRFMVTSAAR